MTTYLGKSCSFCLPRVPFVNCRQFMYLVISLLVLRAGCGIWLYQFLIIGYLFTLNFMFVGQIARIRIRIRKDSLLVKRRNDNYSPGPVIRELVPSSHQRSELSNTILCIFSRWDQRIGEGIPIPDSLGEEATFINICISNVSLKCHRVLISTTPSFGDKVICWYTGFTFKTFI